MPPDAILCGILLLVSFFMAHSAVKVPRTMWIEPVVLWIAIVMPTGSGKTPLFGFLTGILQKVRINSFAVMRNYIACTCVGAHLLGI